MKELDYPDDFPTKNKKRGSRKAKFYTIKEKATELGKNVFKIPADWLDKWSARHAESLNCSCWMCQNPRKVFNGKKKAELTIQELKQLEAEKDET